MSAELHSNSADGRFLLRVQPWEARMSLWVETPSLWGASLNVPILQFADPNWSLSAASWQSNSLLTIKLRRYPGAHRPALLAAMIDCEQKTATFDQRTISISELEQRLMWALQL